MVSRFKNSPESRTMEPRHAGFSNSDKVRTHMMFSSSQATEQTKRSKRVKRDKQGPQHLHDANTQTSQGAIDPAEWTGNQRVLHFGPMGTRDQYYYFYPKGWDILYPAHFGFFPYRTKKYRGSRLTICLSAFGAYFCAGGAVMTYLGYCYPSETAKLGYSLDPLQIAGPAVAGIGVLFLLVGCCWWFCALHLFSEQLRHSQPHHTAPRRVVQHREFAYDRELLSTSQHKSSKHSKPQPTLTPPIPAVVANRNTTGNFYLPEAEMKLFPPSPAMLRPQSTRSVTADPYGTVSLFGGRSDTLPPPGPEAFVYANRDLITRPHGHSSLPRFEYHAGASTRGSGVQDPLEAFEVYDRKQRVIGNPMAGKM